MSSWQAMALGETDQQACWEELHSAGPLFLFLIASLY